MPDMPLMPPIPDIPDMPLMPVWAAPPPGSDHPVMALGAADGRLIEDVVLDKDAVWLRFSVPASGMMVIEAVALGEQHRPDIAFLDIRMPGKTGMEAAREIGEPPVGPVGPAWKGRKP